MSRNAWKEANGVKDDLDRRPADRDGALEARHLSKYIFPLQYSLANAFVKRNHQSTSDYLPSAYYGNREAEIGVRKPLFIQNIAIDLLLLKLRRSCKSPSRLKDVLPLLSQMFRRNSKCKYNILLNTICPSKVCSAFFPEDCSNSSIAEAKLQGQVY